MRWFSSFAAARTAVEGLYRPEVRPSRPGRYYYIATVEVETLSVSDLAELQQWLRASQARRERRRLAARRPRRRRQAPPRPGAGPPARRYEARTESSGCRASWPLSPARLAPYLPHRMFRLGWSRPS